jgi:putative transposase
MACDFVVSVTATFRLLYVSVLTEHGSRRLLHFNVTQHPSGERTLQQLREALGHGDFRYLIHETATTRDKLKLSSQPPAVQCYVITY